MASYNKITIIGNLGRDPEIRSISADRKVADFSIAVTDSYTDKSGQRQEKTEWFRVSFWNQKADVVERFLKKGNQVHVEGKLSVRTYTDKEGKERYSLEVLGQDLTLLGSKQNDAEGGGNNYASSNQPATNSYASNTSSKQMAPPYSSSDDTGDDLPF
jgi:single-strand DNA-binding protein